MNPVHLLPLFIHLAAAGSDLCSLECGARTEGGAVERECAHKAAFAMSANCCRNSTHIIGMDLRNCSLNRLSDSFFDSTLSEEQKLQVATISLEGNPLTAAEVGNETFRGFLALHLLTLPRLGFSSCFPSKNSWENMSASGSVLSCSDQSDYCSFLNDTALALNESFCPQSSGCVRAGPGLVACACSQGHFGYRCLQSGRFPLGAFLGSLGGGTAALSLLLWLTQRRHVKKAHRE